MRAKFFSWLGRFITRHPWKIVAAASVLTVFSIAFAAAHLSIDADQDNLVSERLTFHKRYKNFLREFGDQEYLYLVVEAGNDLPKAKEFVTKAAERLSKLEDVREVTYKIDNPALEKSFLLLLNQEQLKSLSDMVSGGAFSIKEIAKLTSLEEFFGSIRGEVSKPVSTEDEKRLSLGFRFLDDLIVSINEAVVSGTPYQSKMEQLFFGGESFDTEGYLVTQNKRFVICLIMPAKDYETLAVIEGPLGRIRQAIDETRKEFPNINAGLTGRPVLAADEMAASNRDMNTATALAVAAVAVLFVISFKSFTRPVLAVLSLIMGISWTYGFVAVAIGKLNLLSIVFAIILVGASIEYGIHVVARYQEELSHHRHIDEAVKRMLSAVGMADMTSALTTAAAFATLLFTNFLALQQLGAIAGIGIVFCLAAMLVVLPAMLVIRDHKRYRGRAVPEGKIPAPALHIEFITRMYRRPVALLVITAAVTVILLPFARKVAFDFNLLNLQAAGLESVAFERKLIDETDESTWFANSIAGSMKKSASLAGEFRKLQVVKKVEDITTYVPMDQKARMFIIRRMAPHFDELKWIIKDAEARTVKGASDPARLSGKLWSFDSALSTLEEKAFSAGRIDAVEELEGFRERIAALADNLVREPNAGARLEEFEFSFFDDLRDKLSILISGMHPSPLKLDDLPDAIKQRFISKKGNYAIYITPREDIWNPDNLREFVKQIREIDPYVIGTPVEVYESSKIMIRAFLVSAVLSFFVIFVIALADFKSFRAALMVCLPLFLGGAWLLCIMGLMRIPFNLANFFAIPIIIGVGVDSGVHIMHRLRQERSLASIGRATGTSIMLTAASNAAGFGMMMIASHRGIASLGQIMVIGSVCCAAAALVVMPAIAWHVMGLKKRDSHI
jgi:hopanoid biosynthesis associated RND transporter like protein HpnN